MNTQTSEVTFTISNANSKGIILMSDNRYAAIQFKKKTHLDMEFILILILVL